jgi:beta-alanine--pyruvate transaminase
LTFRQPDARCGLPGRDRSEAAQRCCDDDSILIRAAADTLMISPPLVIAQDQIEAIFAAIRRALHAIE